MKQSGYVLGFLFLIIIGGFAFSKYFSKEVVAPVVEENNIKEEIPSIELCFVNFGKPDKEGYYDKYILRMNLTGENVKGSLKLIPAFKDSLVGNFEGKVSAVDKMMMARTIDAFWDTEGEGMKATQQLSIIFGEGTANVGFGEMVDRGDGVYLYKDMEKVDYSMSLTDYSCADLNERESVEKYIYENISTLSKEKAVLGGTWYVTSVELDLQKNTGIVKYEDGHIQTKKSFSYEVGTNGEIINLTLK